MNRMTSIADWALTLVAFPVVLLLRLLGFDLAGWYGVVYYCRAIPRIAGTVRYATNPCWVRSRARRLLQEQITAKRWVHLEPGTSRVILDIHIPFGNIPQIKVQLQPEKR